MGLWDGRGIQQLPVRKRSYAKVSESFVRPCIQSSVPLPPSLRPSLPPPLPPFSLFSLRAAFQYGVKMNDGRKTRRFGGLSDKAKEKAKLNREWQKISRVGSCNWVSFLLISYIVSDIQIIDKRKNPAAVEWVHFFSLHLGLVNLLCVYYYMQDSSKETKSGVKPHNVD